jgi:hypothetical protein
MASYALPEEEERSRKVDLRGVYLFPLHVGGGGGGGGQESSSPL